MEVQSPSWGKSGAKWWVTLAMDPSALQGQEDQPHHVVQGDVDQVQDDLDQDLAHPAWRWQCRPLHFVTRQWGRDSHVVQKKIFTSLES